MKVFHWTGKHPNFGDDINLFLWEHFAPEVLSAEDNLLLVGVGTVLSDGLPEAGAQVIMGSGAGYGVLPADISARNWVIYGVRGPMTTQLLGLDPGLAAVDPAVLLPMMNTFSATPSGRRVFVPHWLTASDTLWRDAAENAGLDFVDPRQDPAVVIQKIIDAELVVAESMHAAIIADAFGVPWVPVICTHASLFKWQDWTASLQMQYRPYRVGPFAFIQGMIQSMRRPQQPKFREAVTPRPAAVGGGRSNATRGRSAHLILNALECMPRSVLVSLLASRLRSLANVKGVLSDRRVLEERQTDLLKRIERLRRDYLSGDLDHYSQTKMGISSGRVENYA